MQMMKEGDKWELYIPSELAYGESQRGQFITPGAVLVFELEIVKVKGPSKQL
jgi:FKBP-type peptidyl-prolyl cis-trans isomerase FklB